MITAVIQHKKDTLVVELPKANTDLQIKLLSIGVRTLPQNIKLFGGEDAEIDVQLASSSRVGQHLCRLFNTENSLGDVNTTAYLVQTADEGIKTDLEHDIYYDQYGTAAELINDIKDRTLALGPVKMSLYFLSSQSWICTVERRCIQSRSMMIRWIRCTEHTLDRKSM